MCLVTVMSANNVSEPNTHILFMVLMQGTHKCFFVVAVGKTWDSLQLVCLIGWCGHFIGALNIYQHLSFPPTGSSQLLLIRSQS